MGDFDIIIFWPQEISYNSFIFLRKDERLSSFIE